MGVGVGRAKAEQRWVDLNGYKEGMKSREEEARMKFDWALTDKNRLRGSRVGGGLSGWRAGCLRAGRGRRGVELLGRRGQGYVEKCSSVTG